MTSIRVDPIGRRTERRSAPAGRSIRARCRPAGSRRGSRSTGQQWGIGAACHASSTAGSRLRAAPPIAHRRSHSSCRWMPRCGSRCRTRRPPPPHRRSRSSPNRLSPGARAPPGEVREIEATRRTAPGAFIVYTDDDTYPEGGVFWTLGTSAGTVLVDPAGASTLLLVLHVGPVGGVVRVTVDGRDRSVTLSPDQTRQLEIPLAAGARFVPVVIAAPGRVPAVRSRTRIHRSAVARVSGPHRSAMTRIVAADPDRRAVGGGRLARSGSGRAERHLLRQRHLVRTRAVSSVDPQPSNDRLLAVWRGAPPPQFSRPGPVHSW